MRMLIVDDNREMVALIREMIDWRTVGITEVVCAYHVDGAKAAFEDKVDIVISDIEMPRTNGLQFIKWVREHEYDCEFIFLTCHDSFHFVQEAMKFSALSYVLKPFDCDELIGEVVKARDRIHKRVNMSTYSALWLENRATVEQKFWRDFLLSDTVPEMAVLNSRMENRRIDIDKSALVSLVLVKLTKATAEDNAEDEESVMFEYRGMQMVLNEIICDASLVGRAIPFQRHDWQYIACLVCGVDRETLLQRCKTLVERYRQLFSEHIACYVGEPVPIHALPRQRERLERLGYSDYRTGVIRLEGQSDAKMPSSMPVDISRVRELLNKGDKLCLMQNMKEQLEMLLAEGKLGLRAMYAIQRSVEQEVFSYLKRCEIETEFLFSDASYCYLQSKAAASTYDMIKWMNYLFTQVIAYEASRREQGAETNRALEFIHAHFAENITREEVARHVCLAPEYFAKQFKKGIGMTVKDYINHCRISAAMDLLKTTNLNITEVASQVGFSDSSYFAVVFKKNTGLSPSEFRAAPHQKEHNGI